MPLVEIRYRLFANAVTEEPHITDVLDAFRENLPAIVANALSTPKEEGGTLPPSDIMLEFNQMSGFDTNCKDFHIRVIAHDYPSRRARLVTIRRMISLEVIKHLPKSTSWYVWVLLMPTSYGSDTESD